jgi:putative transposase
MRFVLRLEDGERMSELCREFGISRKTGYKIYSRFQDLGPAGLYDESRAPKRQWQQTPREIEDLIVKLRKRHVTWGPKKLKAYLERKRPGLTFPAQSTISQILKRRGLISPRYRGRKRHAYPSSKLSKSYAPNEIWCADFKGQFRLQNRKYCFPLTICDHYSRFFLGCTALENTRGYGARRAFIDAFERYGVPKVILTDNGSPFASCGLLGLTTLSAWWKTLGIAHEKIEPGHPEQNGRLERLHLTLKKETTRPAGRNFLQQQERFDRFRREYNTQRPHEALQMKRPNDIYKLGRKTPYRKSKTPDYKCDDWVRKVRSNGWIRFQSKAIYLTKALQGHEVGLRQVSESQWLVSFVDLELGYIDANTQTFTPVDQ